MSEITELYPVAIEIVKRKINEDIDFYFENSKEMPSYDQYITDRRRYFKKIWLNIWTNKAANDVTKKGKRTFLIEKGYEVEGVDRKLINHMFRHEMRTYESFDAIAWLNSRYVNNESKWEERYTKIKSAFIQKQEEADLARQKRTAEEDLKQEAKEIIEENYDTFYVYIRYQVAVQLEKDLKDNQKYHAIPPEKLEEKLVSEGKFLPTDYLNVGTFFEELTGAVHSTFEWSQNPFEYETYYYVYKRLIEKSLSKNLPKWVLERLPTSLIKQYEEVYGVQLKSDFLGYIIDASLVKLHSSYLAKVQDEYVSDLLKVIEVPFDQTIHEEIYQLDKTRRAEEKARELAEIERQKAEEARRIDEIFGQEYRPSLGRNIRYVLHIGETNTGKTHHALIRMKEANSGLYLAPLRLLALEVYDKLNNEDISCNLKTGEEEKEVEGAQHISCTVEMFHEKDSYDVVVIDEAQMLADKDRGFSWYKAITKANAKEVHVIGSRNIKEMLIQLLGDTDIEILDYTREIPLEVEPKAFSIQETQKGDALVCFSRRRVLETASKLQKQGHQVSMIYGSMPPETRKKQINRFSKGETSVVVATDAIGMGLNLPIRRIVFLENEKFDGIRRRRLTSQEVKQIAGRAGRKGIYNKGKVAFTNDIRTMEKLLEKEDESIQTFAIAPTTSVFDRFQRYYRDLGTFFELWEKFESPQGTKKASLIEEQELYQIIRGTEIEARLSIIDLYSLLHMPFSKKEHELTKQWYENVKAIIEGRELPEPNIKKRGLEDLELSYKAIGLHLMFLYRLGRNTEAIYWERVREEISNGVHEMLKTDIKDLKKQCKFCEKELSWDYRFAMCEECYSTRYRQKYYYED